MEVAYFCVILLREIQEALVEIGDKDPSFIGSREWIGAIELSYVLDKLLGVSVMVNFPYLFASVPYELMSIFILMILFLCGLILVKKTLTSSVSQ